MHLPHIIQIPEGLHPDSAELIKELAETVASKMFANQEKYGWTNEWKLQDWEAECRADMLKHIEKGDPRDLAIYAAFMINRRWSTSDNPTPDMVEATTNQKPARQCPDFRFFGARYPDATCIDGALWDLDSNDAEGNLTSGGDRSCPFCRPQQAYEEEASCLDYSEQGDEETEAMYEERMELRLRTSINELRVRHGFDPVTFDPIERH